MRLKPQRILWPTDFSELATLAGRYAGALAELHAAELHAIHVLPPALGPDVSVVLPAELPAVPPDPAVEQQCRAALQRSVGELVADRQVRSDVLIGTPWAGICDYAARAQIDLIVLGTHGRTGLSHVLIGSTAERVVQHAPCAVLTVKAGVRGFLE